MGTSTGAVADAQTRRALAVHLTTSVALVVGAFALALLALARVDAAEELQGRLERDGTPSSAVVIEVSSRVLVDQVTFAYDGVDGERLRSTMLAFNTYERRQPITALVDPDDPSIVSLPGETPLSTGSWVLVVLGGPGAALLLIFGTRRLLRSVRMAHLLRSHPWAPWTLRAAYPRRRRVAVAADDDPEVEHLVRADPRGARRLGRLGRRSPIYLAGSGRWFVLTPAEGRRTLALGRMDVPYERLHLITSAFGSDGPVTTEEP